MKKLRPFLVRLGFAAQMAFHGVLANPLRSLLTVLGVTIGVASVVSLMGIGEGARQAVMEQFDSLGKNVIMVEAQVPEKNFEPSMAYTLPERVKTIKNMTPIVEGETNLVWRRTRGEVDIIGTNSQFLDIRDNAIHEGIFYSEAHVENNIKAVVLGANVANNFHSSRTLVGQSISLGGLEYKIIGILEPKGQGQADGIDDKILMPYTSAMSLLGQNTVSTLIGNAETREDADLAVVQLSRIFRSAGQLNGIEDDAEDTISVTNLNQMVKEADEANSVMTLLLGGIAAVSLLVGGLGIMNIMLVAVSERTGEIGVRRALGARQSDLIVQFLLESLYLSIAGAIIGVITGILVMQAFNSYGFTTAISGVAISVAVGVAVACGLVFGVYPALNASSIPPVEALRKG